MHDVRVNMIENRLYIVLKGKLDMEECRVLSDKIVKNVRRLYPGFVKVTDIRELAPAAEEVRLEIQQMMRTLTNMGMGPVIRVTAPGAAVTANQFQRTSRVVGYTAMEVRSVLEADRLLDEME